MHEFIFNLSIIISVIKYKEGQFWWKNCLILVLILVSVYGSYSMRINIIGNGALVLICVFVDAWI